MRTRVKPFTYRGLGGRSRSHKEDTIRICLAASGGGHLVQIQRLREVYSHHPHFFVTTTKVAFEGVDDDAPAYFVGFSNRSMWLAMVAVFFRVLVVMIRERPNVVISTGAAPGCMACFLGKVLGARVVWVDSFANTEKLSLSGRIIRPFADLTLSQWPNVAKSYKRVEYVGELI